VLFYRNEGKEGDGGKKEGRREGGKKDRKGGEGRRGKKEGGVREEN
jgi:hypothetical protein